MRQPWSRRLRQLFRCGLECPLVSFTKTPRGKRRAPVSECTVRSTTSSPASAQAAFHFHWLKSTRGDAPPSPRTGAALLRGKAARSSALSWHNNDVTTCGETTIAACELLVPHLQTDPMRNTARKPVAHNTAAEASGSLTWRTWSLLALSWVVALTSFLGALFFSEVMKLAPCALCWYQRIAMFPLVLILGIGAFAQDRTCIRYALPLATAGWVIAGYHLLLSEGLIPKDLQPCGQGTSCVEVTLKYGFVTIPMLSLTAFSLVLLLLVAARRMSEK